MTLPEKFSAFVVSEKAKTESDSESGSRSVEAVVDSQFDFSKLDPGEVVIQIRFSALNYKDALAANGHPGVARKFPLIPGIDAVGTVVESSDDSLVVGDEVFVAHAKFGTACHGGLAQFTRVPASWAYKIPEGLDFKSAVTWGTAGFTAAQSVEKIVNADVSKSDQVLVTGATGGVGTFAVKLLAKLGFTVVASTGKKDQHDWLRQQGAAEVICREDVNDTSDSALLKGRWAGVIDTVGGNTLATALKAAAPHACVTACGLVAGHEIPITVYPFILRGVTLCGIDSAGISRETREALWQKIAGPWNLDLQDVATEVSLSEVPDRVQALLNGKVVGRTVVSFLR